MAYSCTHNRARQLWSEPATDVVSHYGDFTRHRFGNVSPVATPVLIAVRNGEQDLPATLVSLAESSGNCQIEPIVIDNRSADNTTEIAEKMGATVLEEALFGKLRALKTGLDYVVSTRGTDNTCVLFTDDDTIVSRRWAEHMRLACLQVDGDAFVSGLVILGGGHNRRTDLARTVLGNLAQYRRKISGKPPSARGSNMAIQLSDDLLGNIYSIPDDIFPGVDAAIRDVAISSGATGIFVDKFEALVVSKGDRFTTIASSILTGLGLWNRSNYYDETLTEGMRQYHGEYRADCS